MSALPLKADIQRSKRNVRHKQSLKADCLGLVGSIGSEPSGAPYQQQGPRYTATGYYCQCYPGSMLLSRHGPVCNITWIHNKPAAVTGILA